MTGFRRIWLNQAELETLSRDKVSRETSEGWAQDRALKEAAQARHRVTASLESSPRRRDPSRATWLLLNVVLISAAGVSNLVASRLETISSVTALACALGAETLIRSPKRLISSVGALQS